MSASKGSLGLRVLEGVQGNLAMQILVFALNLYLTPKIVGPLGPDGYGLYTLMWTLLAYLILFCLGTGTAVTRYTALWGARASSPLHALLRRTLAFQAAAGALLGAVLFFGRHRIAGLVFHAVGPARDAAPGVLAWVAASLPFYFILQFSICVLYGQQRFKAYNWSQALLSAPVAAAACVLLNGGYGLSEIAKAFFVIHAVLGIFYLFLVRQALIPGRGPDARELEDFKLFAFKGWWGQILWTAAAQGDRAFIAKLLPLSQMGYYAVSSSIAQKFNAFCGSVTAIATPIIAELHGSGQEARLRRFYLKATELSLFFILPVSILSFILMPQFMTLWLGPEFSRVSTWPFRWLVLANLATFLGYLPNALAGAKGEPHLYSAAQAVKVLLMGALWLALIPSLGIVGASLGPLAAEWLVAPFYIVYVHRRFLGLGAGEFLWEACARPAAACAGPAALALAWHGAVGSWVELAAFGGAGLALFLGIGYALLDQPARQLLADWLRGKLKAKTA